MKIEEITNKEIIETLNKLKSYFDSPFFENNRSIINALEVAIEAIKDKEKFNKTLKTDDWINKYQKWLYDQFKS